MSEEELYNNIVEILSKGDFLQINGKPINLKELNDYINSQQQEIERLNNIINELEKYINENYIYDEVGMKIFDASTLQDKLQELLSVLGGDKDVSVKEL